MIEITGGNSEPRPLYGGILVPVLLVKAVDENEWKSLLISGYVQDLIKACYKVSEDLEPLPPNAHAFSGQSPP